MRKKIQPPQNANTNKLHLTYAKKMIPNRISLNDAMRKFSFNEALVGCFPSLS
jgi:hypothetical protein